MAEIVQCMGHISLAKQQVIYHIWYLSGGDWWSHLRACPRQHFFALCILASSYPFGFSLLQDSLTVPMLVDLIKKHGPSVQTACLGVMQNLSSNSAFHQKLLEQGVLEALDAAKDVDGGALGSQCAAVLYNFSLEEKSLTQMMELGAIFLVTHLSHSHVMKVRFRMYLCSFSVCL